MSRNNDQELAQQRKRYVIRGTVFFAVVEMVVFIPLIWSTGFHSTRDVVGLALLVLLATSCGLMFSLVTWKFLRGWFGG